MKISEHCDRPVFRYYGGKWRIAPQIIALMPKHEVYVEAFAGSAAVLLQKPRVNCEILNDRWDELINVFRCLRDHGEIMLRGLYFTPYARTEYVHAYEPTQDPIEAARRFIYRSTAGIGTDSSRRRNGFKTSLDDGRYGRSKSWASLPENVVQVIERLRGVEIENKDALSVMGQFDRPHTLHYVDPPYMAATRKAPKEGYRHEMMHETSHRELLAFLRTLKGKVIVSGYPHPLYDRVLKGWHRRELQGARDQTNEARPECVWMNYQPEDLLF